MCDVDADSSVGVCELDSEAISIGFVGMSAFGFRNTAFAGLSTELNARVVQNESLLYGLQKLARGGGGSRGVGWNRGSLRGEEGRFVGGIGGGTGGY